MKVIVTGGAGFVGSHLCQKLLERGDSVVAIDNFNDFYSVAQKRDNAARLLQYPEFKLIEKDFCDPQVIDHLFSEFKPEAIAHLGAMANVRYSVKNPAIFMQVNVVGTNNLLEHAVKYNVNNFVFASTSSVYGQRSEVPFLESDPSDKPLAPYPASKKSGELLGHAFHNMHGLNFTALRFFNVYGPSGRPDMMPFIVTDHLLKDQEITLFDAGDMYRDWTFVADTVNGVMAAIDRPLGFEIINLGRGEPQSMNEFMEIMQQLTGKKAIIKSVAAPLSEPKITFASIDHAKKILDYNPETSLAAGLASFWDWYKVGRLN